MKKSWKPYLGLYAISSHGEVVSMYFHSQKKERFNLRFLKLVKTQDGYMTCSFGKGKNKNIHAVMAELFIGPANGRQVDHVNGDRSDNRISNLRYCSRDENTRNQRLGKNNTTGYKGVSRQGNSWRAYIYANGSGFNLGLHKSLDEAAHAYNKAAIILHGDFACLNPVGGS